MKTKILVALLVMVTAGLMNSDARAGLGDGLVGYWALDGDATDSSGNGHDGTVVGTGSSFVEGMFGGAFRTTDNGDHIVTSDNSIGDALNGKFEITMSAWVKSDVTGTDRGYLMLFVPHGSDDGGMRYDNNGGDNVQKISVGNGGSEESAETSFLAQTTEWQHNLMTWKSDDGGIKMYINGELNVLTEPFSSGAFAGAMGHYTNLHIGRGAKDEGGGESWLGLIDEVRIWDRKLSPDEVTKVFLNQFETADVRNASPANGATFVAIEIEALTWDDGLDPNSLLGEFVFDVYFGTDPNCGPGFNPLVVDGLHVPPHEPNALTHSYIIDPSPLAYDTTYYWQVDVIGPNELGPGLAVITSSCFNFKTLPATPVIQSDPENVLVGDGGGPVTYTVTATDTGLFGDIAYQWFGSISGALADGGNISGVNDGLGTGTSTLTIDPAGFPDEQDYFCIASNNEGAGDLSTSDSAFLRIKQLLAYYKLDTNGDDFSGNAYHGTLVDTDPNGGGAFFTTGSQGMLGEALQLNGTLAHIITGSGIADALNGNEAITMSAWVKSNSNTFNDNGFLHFVEPHSGDDGGMRYDSNTGDDVENVLKVGVGLEGASEHNAESSGGAQSTEWRHYVMTWARGENLKLYINGTLNALSEISAGAEADLAIAHYTALYIGLGAKDELDGSNIGSGWDGLIDEVKIYNFPLSPEEVASLSFAISGVPVCLVDVALDTNDDCIQNLEELVEWLESYLECTQVVPGGAGPEGSTCVPTEVAP